MTIRLDSLLDSGLVANQTEIAKTVGITTARVTQILNLTYLAPDIQQTILELEPTTQPRDHPYLLAVVVLQPGVSMRHILAVMPALLAIIGPSQIASSQQPISKGEWAYSLHLRRQDASVKRE